MWALHDLPTGTQMARKMSLKAFHLIFCDAAGLAVVSAARRGACADNCPVFGGIAVAAGILVIIYGVYFFEETEKDKLSVKSIRKFLKTIFAAAAMSVFTMSQLFACPACGSANSNMPSSPLTDGMNLGILTLFVVIATVLGFHRHAFFVFIIRREAGASRQNRR